MLGQNPARACGPVAGYLSEAQSRAGDVVKAGQVMATLDDRDLRLERLKWATQRAKQQREYSEALAKQELAKAQVLRTQIEQADAQLTLLDEQISRLRITAPFNRMGIVSATSASSLARRLSAATSCSRSRRLTSIASSSRSTSATSSR